MTQDWPGPEWKPERSKIVFTMDAGASAPMFQVDSGASNAWKRELLQADQNRAIGAFDVEAQKA